MVLYCLKWNIHPDKAEAYATWSKGAIQRTLGAGGVTEFRGYRPASGAFQVVVTYEFADMAAWAAWHETETVQAVLTEVHTLANDVTSDLWGPSPIVPQPIRPES
jgi:quinol monooxygenase YgiN